MKWLNEETNYSWGAFIFYFHLVRIRDILKCLQKFQFQFSLEMNVLRFPESNKDQYLLIKKKSRTWSHSLKNIQDILWFWHIWKIIQLNWNKKQKLFHDWRFWQFFWHSTIWAGKLKLRPKVPLYWYKPVCWISSNWLSPFESSTSSDQFPLRKLRGVNRPVGIYNFIYLIQ